MVLLARGYLRVLVGKLQQLSAKKAGPDGLGLGGHAAFVHFLDPGCHSLHHIPAAPAPTSYHGLAAS